MRVLAVYGLDVEWAEVVGLSVSGIDVVDVASQRFGFGCGGDGRSYGLADSSISTGSKGETAIVKLGGSAQ